MSYKHGIYISETTTRLIPTVGVDSAIPFVVGTGPINQIENPEINKPIRVQSYAEAVAAVGFEDAIDNGSGKKAFRFTLSEFMACHFSLYATVPAIFVNVLDPTKHKAAMTTTAATLIDGSATIKEAGILASSVAVSSTQTGTVKTYTRGKDYSLSFDEAGDLVITSLKDDNGVLLLPAAVTISGEKLDPTKVTEADIIGGINAVTGQNEGLECVADVFPRFRCVPNLIMAPGFSSAPAVAIAMGKKTTGINGHFGAIAIVDAPADTVRRYTDVPEWKNSNGITGENSIVCWPQMIVDDVIYHASVQLAGVIGKVDQAASAIPYCSPSNRTVEISGICLADGTEVILGMEQANFLNGNGIVTASNFISGWKIWGNRTACYPGNTDPKDSFIAVRRMFQWVANTIVTTVWDKVDQPGNRRLIDSVIDSLNVWLNSLSANRQLLGGRIEFRNVDNPDADLMDGKYRFKVYLTPPSPAEQISFDLEIDPDYYSGLYTSQE